MRCAGAVGEREADRELRGERQRGGQKGAGDGRWCASRYITQRGCDYALIVPCASGSGAIAVDTRSMPDGSQALSVDALDAADNPSVSTPIWTRVDNTAPGAVSVDVAGGGSWRNQNDFDVAWANAPEDDRAPVVAAHYEICRLSGGECTRSDADTGARSPLWRMSLCQRTANGNLRVWREDAAGNHEPSNASVACAAEVRPGAAPAVIRAKQSPRTRRLSPWRRATAYPGSRRARSS